jgi:hypothetical protein
LKASSSKDLNKNVLVIALYCVIFFKEQFLNMASRMDGLSVPEGPIIRHRWVQYHIVPHTVPDLADVGLADYYPVLLDRLCASLTRGGVVVDHDWVCELMHHYIISLKI